LNGDFDEFGNLPPGVRFATWSEITERFGYTPRRRKMLEGLKLALSDFKGAGCVVAYLDGSFVTSKLDPQDYDCCWETTGVNPGLIKDKILLDTSRKSVIRQKLLYGGEFWSNSRAIDSVGKSMFSFFQHDREGRRKGIIAIDLGNLN
jgi:Family of unknown function (DUF6932)